MDIENKPKKTLENGQVLVEIENNIWVDFETLCPPDNPITQDNSEG